MEEKDLARAMCLVKGDLDPGMFFDEVTLERLSKTFAKEPKEWFDKYMKREKYATDMAAEFPPAPDVRDKTLLV
jgi:hypothetical protein